MAEMGLLIKADDGDSIVVHAYHFSEAEFIVSFRVDSCFNEGTDMSDWITLSAEEARRFGRALIAAADGVAFADDCFVPGDMAHFGVDRLQRPRAL